MNKNLLKYIGLNEVLEKTGFSQKALMMKINAGTFPSPFLIDDVGMVWLVNEVNEWLDMIKDRRGG